MQVLASEGAVLRLQVCQRRIQRSFISALLFWPHENFHVGQGYLPLLVQDLRQCRGAERRTLQQSFTNLKFEASTC